MKARYFILLLFLLSVPPAMYGQDRKVGGPCEGCEAIHEYYLDEYLFDDDPLLTQSYLAKLKNRGGSGVLRLKDVGNMYKAERHIRLI